MESETFFDETSEKITCEWHVNNDNDGDVARYLILVLIERKKETKSKVK